MVATVFILFYFYKGQRRARRVVQCCFTFTETIRTIRDGEPRTSTSTLTHLLSSESSLSDCLNISSQRVAYFTGDSLGEHRFRPFSTMDTDNDQSVNTSCAQHFKAAWWFNDCYVSSLNGQYKFNSSTPDGEGLHWNSWRFDSFYSLKSSQMKIRPMP